MMYVESKSIISSLTYNLPTGPGTLGVRGYLHRTVNSPLIILAVSEAYMVGEIQVDDLPGVMNVSASSLTPMMAVGDPALSVIYQIWLDNQSTIIGLSSKASRLTAVLSGLSNALLGQTRSQARLNAIASYDQSNELFKVSTLTYIWSAVRGSENVGNLVRHFSVRK